MMFFHLYRCKRCHQSMSKLSVSVYRPCLSNHHTLIFDTVITNMNSAYSKFTGVFTVPVGGTYGFTYNVRMGCHTSTTVGPFEIIKNDVAEGNAVG
jgi:hypothetical protein